MVGLVKTCEISHHGPPQRLSPIDSVDLVAQPHAHTNANIFVAWLTDVVLGWPRSLFGETQNAKTDGRCYLLRPIRSSLFGHRDHRHTLSDEDPTAHIPIAILWREAVMSRFNS